MAKQAKLKVGEALAKKVLSVVDKGLIAGSVGEPIPGQMCVEAAVAYAMGEPHSDAPSCVAPFIRAEKIDLNDDFHYKNDKSRGKALRRVAIAQLGTKGRFVSPKDRKQYMRLLAEQLEPHLVAQYAPFLKSLREAVKLVEKAKGYDDLMKGLFQLKNLFSERDFSNADCTKPATLADRRITSVTDFRDELNLPGQQTAEIAAEAMVQALKKMKAKGTKYLYLTE